MDTYFKQVKVAYGHDENRSGQADVDVEVDKTAGRVLLGLWPDDVLDGSGMFVSMTPDQAREVVEAIHFAITTVEFGAAFEAEDVE